MGTFNAWVHEYGCISYKMYQIIKDHQTNTLIATLPQIRVERGNFPVNQLQAMHTIQSEGKNAKKLPVNSRVAVNLYDVPFLLQPGNHQQSDNRTFRLLRKRTPLTSASKRGSWQASLMFTGRPVEATSSAMLLFISQSEYDDFSMLSLKLSGHQGRR